MTMQEEYAIENKMYYHDTDAGGVVYYAKYLEHLEEGRCEFFRSHGVDLAVWAKKGIQFAVVHLEIEYKAPARYGDSIKVYTRVVKIGHASMRFSQEIKRGVDTLVVAQTVLACIEKSFVACAVPLEIRQAFKGS